MSMILFIRENWGTIVTALIVFAAVTGVIVNLIRNRRKSSCCSCGCGLCTKAGHLRKNDAPRPDAPPQTGERVPGMDPPANQPEIHA
jgi:hypothetical protein